jgi:hypothetical protein
VLTTIGKLAIGGVAVLTTLVGGVTVAWGISDPGPTPTLLDAGPSTITTPTPVWSESSPELVLPTPTTQAPAPPPRPPAIRRTNPPPVPGCGRRP